MSATYEEKSAAIVENDSTDARHLHPSTLAELATPQVRGLTKKPLAHHR